MQATPRGTDVTHDVIVIGGGMVGAALACALGDTGVRVGLVERDSPAPMPSGEFDLRVSAITRGSRRILEAVNVWARLDAGRICPIEEMHIWDAGGVGAIHFDSAEIGQPCLAYIIENNALRAALWDKLQRLENVRCYCPNQISMIDLCDSQVTLTLDDSSRLKTGLVVGADGPKSRVRAAARITTKGWDYEQQGIVATVATEQPHDYVAWQRFLPTGPLAFLPLTDGRSSIVWSVDAGYAAHLLALDDAAFLQALATAFGDRLGTLTATSVRAAFPLQRAHAERYVGQRVALIGDAAHTVHPLAGQGVNLGLLDAAVLAEVIADARRVKRDIGAETVLRRYERWRKRDNLAMLFVTDMLKRLFGSPLGTAARLRNIGLDITNAATPIKNTLMRRAAGLEGDLPRLARAANAVQG
ncbi:MAG: UbiH/UbiF/VisC/COQ6 family ubiquinone biosynthesis hydroxylase [Acidiferrobacterales bacterium]